MEYVNIGTPSLPTGPLGNKPSKPEKVLENGSK
jgi:hypothetical protein